MFFVIFFTLSFVFVTLLRTPPTYLFAIINEKHIYSNAKWLKYHSHSKMKEGKFPSLHRGRIFFLFLLLLQAAAAAAALRGGSKKKKKHQEVEERRRRTTA